VSPLTEARSARSWCDEERAPYSTKREKVSPLTEARSARSWCDEERAPYSTKREKVSPLTEARSARKLIPTFLWSPFVPPFFFKGTDENLKFFPLTKGDARGIFRIRDTPLKEGN